jgi:hypothetical protein
MCGSLLLLEAGEKSMVKIGVVAVVALGIVGVLLGWSGSLVGGEPATSQMISIQEIHALAHVKGLPVEHFEETSVSYPIVAQK